VTENQTPDLQVQEDESPEGGPADDAGAEAESVLDEGEHTGDAAAEGVPAEGGRSGDAADEGERTGDAVDEGVPAEGVPVEGDVAALLEDDVVVAEDAIDDVTMRRALEAILMVSDEPLPALTLARTVGRAVADVTAGLAGLSEDYTEQGRGFDLREVGGGWRYYTREDTALYVERFVLDGQQSRLTQAALETLAVVAYKQPVSRARVSAIRGVNVDGVMRTLISRGLLEEAGPDTESQSTLYRTTSYFLERMGMQSLDDLPELAPYLPEMDDMEEELAAQATADSGEAAPAEEDAGPIENDLAPPPVVPVVEEDDGEELSGDEADDGFARGETDESATRG
jgi:segregation and condensation protein B